jgi:pantoate--beta-alanine ligase
MIITGSIEETGKAIAKARAEGKKIGFVPTMGYLHKGHISLVDISKQHTEFQVMSLFVNRIQFNDKNDFLNYPKDFEMDSNAARDAGVDLLFTPDDVEMYRDALTTVDVAMLTDNLCGAHRPGHFKGVFTVVSKLFNIVQPDISVFGQKDIQQAVSIEKMTADLNFPVKIIIAPIIREDDGLAMSSRNARLTPVHRKNSVVINAAFRLAEKMILSGERNSEKIISAMREKILTGSPDSIDYISAVRYSTLATVDELSDKSVIAAAVFFGGVRLIDNMIIEFSAGGAKCVY